jgi:feruloyl esterase
MRITLTLPVLLALFAGPALAASCESLASLALPHTTITLAQSVKPGEFTPPPGPPAGSGPQFFHELPGFCRVAATLTPTSDSDIKIEVWMPLTGWNGKFQAVGNGGWSGAIAYPGLAGGVRHGYSTASTDTGHSGGGGEFVLGHPEKLIDFGYRAVHEMTITAKAIITAFNGSGPKLSYWQGCSSGGKQGLKEAQRYPADYDGIVAGAPANNWTHLEAGSLWVAHAVHKDPLSFIPQEKYRLIHQAVLEACDALDGVKDGVLEDPVRCHFDPGVLQCKGEDTAPCLTAPQVEAARKIYAPATNPRTGKEIYPGLEPGSEMGWGPLAGPRPLPIATDEFKYEVFKDANWDWRTLNFDDDVARADKADNGIINATDPNLRQFIARGGKLLLYHGWNDSLISPLNTVEYYKNVQYTLGSPEDSVRLFMVPGMMHCGGGDGTDVFDKTGVIERWVEQGEAPDRIVAARIAGGKRVRTRPLCPYPQTAQYKGTGSSDDADNFVCKAP